MSSDDGRETDSQADRSQDRLPLSRRNYLQVTGAAAVGSFTATGGAAAQNQKHNAQKDKKYHQSDKLDPDQFESPPASSRPTILWWWNGTMSEEVITQQLANMRSVGIRDAVIFPRSLDSPLKPEFFTKAYFDRIGFAVKEAKDNDMTLWLFNDNIFPSARGAGYVLEGGKIGNQEFEPHPEFRKQQLLRNTEHISGPTTIDLQKRLAGSLPRGLRIDKGKLLVSGPDLKGYITLLDHGFDWTDYRFSFDTQPRQAERRAKTYAQSGWAFRAQDTNNTYVWLLTNISRPGTKGSLTKFAIKDGERQAVTTEPLSFNVVSDEWYHVETTVDGNEITTSINGQQIDVTTDNTFNEGTVGFREGNHEEALFDNICVENLNGDVLYKKKFEGSDPTGFEQSLDISVVAGLPVEDDEPQLQEAISLTELFEEGKQWDVPPGEFVLEFYNRQFSQRTNPRNQLIDVMSSEAVAQYIDVIHEQYFQRFSDDFGTTIRGFWDDIERGPLRGAGGVPWSPSLPDELDSLGYAPAEVLPAAFRNFGEVGREERGAFWHAVYNRFADAYFHEQGQWAGKHNINMISNAFDNSGPARNAKKAGDLLKNYQWFQTPGADIISNQINPASGIGRNRLAPRYASSSAHQMGRPWVLSENLGNFGWDVTPALARYVNGYMAIRGANMTVLHSYWSNNDPDLIVAPPPIQPMNTWWFAMDELVEWTSRVMEVNQGNPSLETALLQPQRAIEDYRDTAEQGQLNSGFQRVAFALENIQVDFDLLDESSIDGDPEMRRHASVHSGEMEIGPQHYRVVVIPPTPLLSLETVERLTKLARSGGVVVAVGRLPTEEADDRDSKLQKALSDLFDTHPTNPAEGTHSIGSGTAAFASDTDTMQKIVREADAPAVSLPSTDRTKDITVLRRDRDGDQVFLMMNEASEPFETEATFPISGIPEIWDAADGSTQTATQFHAVDDGTIVPLHIDPFDVIAVVFSSSNDVHKGHGNRKGHNNVSQVPHILTSDLPVTAVKQVDGKTLSATVRAESVETAHLAGRTGGRIYDGTVDITGAFDPIKITGSWRFRFERDNAEWRNVSLGSWTDIDSTFSGTGIYETTVTLSKADLNDRRLRLDLGRVQDVAQVEVNDKQMDTLTVRPYQVDVTDALETGENQLRIHVTNTNANEHGNSLPSGLFGPVCLDPFKLAQTDLTLNPGGRVTDLSIDATDITLFPGQETTVTATVTNLLRRPVRDTLSATINGSLQVSPQSTPLQLGGRETATTDIRATVSHSAIGGKFELTMEFNGQTETITITIPQVVNTNLARHGAANASSSHSGYPARQAIDRDTDSSDWGQTGWNDNTRSEFPDWLEVSFPVPLAVNQVDVFTLNSAKNPASEYGLRDYDVQVLINGEYQTIANVRDNTRGHIPSEFDSVSTEAVRLLIHNTNDGNYSRVVEFEIYNKKG